MSNYDAEDNFDAFDTPKTSPEQQLRNAKRQFDGKLEAWHFRLIPTIEYYQAFFFFRNAKLKDDTLWFDGSCRNGKICYDWVSQHYQSTVFNALGSVRVALARHGVILNSFYTTKVNCVSKDELMLMLSLARRCAAGEKVDSYVELAAHRGIAEEPTMIEPA